MTKDYLAVVLAAGDGTRMKSSEPKILHEVAGKHIITHVLDSLAGAGIGRSNTVLVLNYGREKILSKTGTDIDYVVQSELLGTGDAVLRARDIAKQKGFCGNLIVGCGDAPLISSETIEGLIALHEKEGNACTILSGIPEDASGYGRIVRCEDGGRVLAIVEDRDADEAQKQINEVNSGMYCFSCPDLFELIESTENNNSQGEYYLTDVVRKIIEKGGHVGAYVCEDDEEILGVNDRFDLAVACDVMRRRNLVFHMERGVSVVDMGSTHIDCDVEIGQDTIIYPYSVIRSNVKIGKGCKIGPFAHIEVNTDFSDKVEIGNFVEVKRSSIGEGVKAKHLSYIGDTTIGRKTNIGAGTIVANYDGRNKHKTSIDENAFIGSGSILIAPNKIGSGAVTAAGAVVTKNSDVEPDTIVAGVPAKFLRKKNRGTDGK